MSFYVGPERFEPTQRDAQWRNRCSAEVQSYANYRSGGGLQIGRGRDPILGVDDGMQREKFVVVPNPEKIGALNAEVHTSPWEEPPHLAARKKQPPEAVLVADRLEGVPAAAAMRAALAAGNPMTADQFKVRFSPPASFAGSGAGSFPKGGGLLGKRRSGTGNSEGSTLSGGGSSIASSSAAYRDARAAAGRAPVEKLSSAGGRSGELPRTASGAGSSSVSTRSTKSSVLYEALGEETRRRVEAEKEVQRLAALLEERAC